MAEEQTTDTTTSTTVQPADAKPATGAESTTTQDTDWQAQAEKWKALSRQNEAQAKANAEKAQKFDEFQESQKTELEKAHDEAAKWQTQYEQAQKQALRAETAAKHQLPLELLTGGTSDELDAQVTALLAWKGSKPAASSGPDMRQHGESTPTFTRQQIADPDFYHAHRADILKAQQAGRITA